MDVLKVFMVVLLACLFAFLSLLFMVGFLAANTDPSNPQIIILCGVPALGFSLASLWTIRIAWLQILQKSEQQGKREVPLNLAEALRTVISKDFNVSRLTGAGWMLGTISFLSPLVVFAIVTGIQESPWGIFIMQRRYQLVILSSMIIIFGTGYTLLASLHITVVQREDVTDKTDSELGDSN